MKAAAASLLVLCLCACGAQTQKTQPFLLVRFHGGQSPELPKQRAPSSCRQLSELELVHGESVGLLAHPVPRTVAVTAAGSTEHLGGGRIVRWRVRGPGGLLSLQADQRRYGFCYMTDYSLAAVRKALGPDARVTRRLTRHPGAILTGPGYTVRFFNYAVDARDAFHGGNAIRWGNLLVSGPGRAAAARRLRSLG